jgi:glycosyltransferase involved in cell wall biosynthesis
MATSLPLISIVLPTFNGARYLREAIESCLHQTYPNWELILVDDASTDETPSIIAEYVARDSRVISLRNPVNRKLPGSLNAGFARARGELLTWTSDDNCYRSQALNQMAAFLETNPSVDLVYADFTVIDDRSMATGEGWVGPVEELPLRNSIGACFLYRRTVYDRLGGYDEDLPLVEDWDYWLRASASFRLARLREDLYLYRCHKDSLTETQLERIRPAQERCLAKNLPRLTWLDRDLRASAYKNLVELAMKRRDRRAALSHVLGWVRSDPLLVLRRGLRSVASVLLPAPLQELTKPPQERTWLHRLRRAANEIRGLVPAGATFILVDEGQCAGGELGAERHVLPFLERDGQYWGAPEDDATAIRELERLRRSGASCLVFAWPAFWWLEYYAEFHRYLRSNFCRVLADDLLVAFDLLSNGPVQQEQAVLSAPAVQLTAGAR